MNSGKWIVFASMISAAILAGTADAVVQYTVTDLGTLGVESYASAINDQGQVTGYSNISANVSRMFLYSGGVMQDQGTLPAYPFSKGTAINNNGEAVGYAYYSIAASPFLVTGGTRQELPFNSAYGINDSGQILLNDNSRTYILSNNVAHSLGSLGGSNSTSQGYAINAGGEATGFSFTSSHQRHAFLYTGDTMQDIHTLDSYDSVGYAINDKGQVAGRILSQTDFSYSHSFLYSDGVMHDLGTFGGSMSMAYGMNESGQVVGTYGKAGVFIHAYVYSNGIMNDLNDLLVPGSGWTLTQANDINNNGLIVGSGKNSAGQTHAFLLTPVPEPTSLALLAVGLLAMMCRRI